MQNKFERVENHNANDIAPVRTQKKQCCKNKRKNIVCKTFIFILTKMPKIPSCIKCNVRENWRKSTIQPMILFVSFSSSLLNNLVEEQLKSTLCEKDANENPYFQPTNVTCDDVVDIPNLESKLNAWVLYKNCLQYLPAVIFGPLSAILFEKLPAERKHWPVYFNPVGVLLSAMVFTVAFETFTKPYQILLCLLPLALMGGVPMLGLTGFIYMSYKTIGNPSRRISKFVMVQGLFVAGKAIATILLAALASKLPGHVFCVLSVVFAWFGVLFIRYKTGVKTEELELVTKDIGEMNFVANKRKVLHIALLFLCVLAYFLTGAMTNLIQAVALVLFAHFVRGTLKKRVFQNHLLPKHDATFIGLVGWVTCIAAKVIYTFSDTWAGYVSVAVRSLSQLSVTMSYYLLSTMVPFDVPGRALVWGGIAEIAGTLPAKPLEQELSKILSWEGAVYLIQAAILLQPLITFLYLYGYYRRLKTSAATSQLRPIIIITDTTSNPDYGSIIGNNETSQQ